MKTFFTTLSMAFVLSFALFFTSAAGQDSSVDKILVNNAEHYVFYRVDEKNVVLTFELINDFTDNTRGDYPIIDFVGVAVDVDQNAEISERIDTGYGLKGKPRWKTKEWSNKPFVTGLCTNFLIDSISSTGCGQFKSDASLDFGFRTTDKQSENHPVYIFTIPRKELSKDGKSAHIRLQTYSNGKGFAYYPAKETGEKYHSFFKVLKLEF